MVSTMDASQDGSRRLICLIEGGSTIFSVTAGRNIEVGELKEVIKNKRANTFKDVDPDDLQLWKVDIDLETHNMNFLSQLKLANHEDKHKLEPYMSIFQYWTNQPPLKHLHLIVKAPATVSRKRAVSPREEDAERRKRIRLGWEEDPLWTEFYREWWGSSERTHIEDDSERFLHISQEGLFPLLNRTEGAVYVRKEYQAFHRRLWNARKMTTAAWMNGVLLLGQPGIGKSFFLVYLLLEILSQKETVIFTTSDGTTILFNDWGAYFKPAKKIYSVSDLPRDGRIWSLVDCPEDKEVIPGRVTYQTGNIFWVAALSPDQSRYKEAQKQTSTRIWWMSPWTVEEICSLTSKAPFSGNKARWKTFPTVEDSIRALWEEVGPCPRDIIARMSDVRKYEGAISQALNEYDNPTSIISLFQYNESDMLSRRHSHNIILVKRVGPVLEEFYDTDATSVTLKNKRIFRHVMNKFLSLQLQEAKQLFNTCSGIGPSGAVFAGHLFEGLAIRYTSGKDLWDSEAIGPFTVMKQVESQGKKFPIRFRYQMANYELVVAVNAAGCTIFRISPPKTSSSQDNPQPKPWSHRTLAVYYKDTTPNVDASQYYRPHASNHPLFDAFFYDISETKIILWVIQITKQRNHDGSSQGFSIIDKLKKAAHDAKKLPVEVKYVLVVPQSDPGVNAEWNFAPEFRQHEGEVFLQQLNLSVFGDRNWDLEALLDTTIVNAPGEDVSVVEPLVSEDMLMGDL